MAEEELDLLEDCELGFKTFWSLFHLCKPVIDWFIYFGLCRGISGVLKVIATPQCLVCTTEHNRFLSNSGCGFRGGVSVWCKFDRLHTVILVVKTIDLKSFKDLIFFFFFLFFFVCLFPCFLLLVSACPQLFLWLCAWKDPESLSSFRDIH